MKTLLKRFFYALLAIVATLFCLLYFTPMPENTTEPHVLAGDGSQINYCELPVLDGSGKLAADIPQANTPGCSYTHFPLPILAECTEPLPDNATDIRGLWQAIEGDKLGHVERIELCGQRAVITAAGIIHDTSPTHTSNDTQGAVLFMIGDKAFCPRTTAGTQWNNGALEYHAFGWGPVVVRRRLDGEHMVWEYADGGVTRHERLCQLPESHKIPKKRGPRFRLF